MAFQGLLKRILFFALMVGCVYPATGLGKDQAYFSTWKPTLPGKYSLVWYYNSVKDFHKKQPNKVVVGDKEFVILPDVRPPTINSVYQLDYIHINPGEEVLDLGTGSGLVAIYAAEKAKRVVATDIFAPAIDNAKLNARRHGVEDKIDFRVGDLFDPIDEDERFDVITFNINLPFELDDKARKNLHERIFAEVRDYLKPKGRIYYQTSFVRNVAYIYDLLNRNRFRIMEMHMLRMENISHEPLFVMVQSR